MVDDWLGCPWVGLHRLLEFGYQETRSKLYFLFLFSVDSSASIYQHSASVLATPLLLYTVVSCSPFRNQTGPFLSFPTLVFTHIENRDKWPFFLKKKRRCCPFWVYIHERSYYAGRAVPSGEHHNYWREAHGQQFYQDYWRLRSLELLSVIYLVGSSSSPAWGGWQ